MYKPELQPAITQRLQQFLQEEVGNRVTPNNMTGLSVSLGKIFEQHLVPNNAQEQAEKTKTPPGKG